MHEEEPKVVIAAKHTTIDNLYSRVTKAGFEEIMVMSAQIGCVVDIRESIRALTTALGSFSGQNPSAVEAAASSVVDEGAKIVTSIDEIAEWSAVKAKKNQQPLKQAMGKEILEDVNKVFFEALFQLVKVTADRLELEPKKEETAKAKKKAARKRVAKKKAANAAAQKAAKKAARSSY